MISTSQLSDSANNICIMWNYLILSLYTFAQMYIETQMLKMFFN